VLLRQQLIWFYILGALFIGLNAIFIYTEEYFLMAIPFALAVIYASLFNMDKLLLFIAFCAPLSLNLEDLEIGGIGFYLPTEPLLFGLLIIFVFTQIHKLKLDRRVIRHPISIAVLINLSWMFFTCITSEMPLISFKFLLSRLWFVVPIFYLGTLLFKDRKNITKYIWLYILPFTGVIVYTVASHSAYAFDEEAGHWVMSPFYKDHTSYGAIIALFIPVVFGSVVFKEYSSTRRLFAVFILLIMAIGIYFSYTRAAWLSLLGASFVYLAIILRIRFVYILGALGIVVSLIFANWDNIVMGLEKNKSEHTAKEIDERLQSVTNITTDASNLERINRWNCAVRMFKKRPLLGWGPGVYQFKYATFQHSSETTIISTNFGDGGNAHSEYLGPMAESGILGFLTFSIIVALVIITAIKLFYVLHDRELKMLVLCLLLGLITYFAHGILNNYLDTDKASIPVWGFISIIVSIDIYHRNAGKKEKELEEPTAE
jgi:putative inorganic carbon (HCO3(-)) transporter